jgi:hypothetical protein
MQRGVAHFQATGDLPDELFAPDLIWDMSKFGGWPEQQIYKGNSASARLPARLDEPVE